MRHTVEWELHVAALGIGPALPCPALPCAGPFNMQQVPFKPVCTEDYSMLQLLIPVSLRSCDSTTYSLLILAAPEPLSFLSVCAAGKGFASWGSAQHLTALSLQNGWQVTDEGMEHLGLCLTALRSLNLKGCRLITDAGLAALVHLRRLTHLSLQVPMQHNV